MPEYHSVLADPASLGPLTFDGQSEDGRWLAGRLLSWQGCRAYWVRQGIADFVGDSCGWLDSPPIEQGRREGFVKARWEAGGRRWSRVKEARSGRVSDWGRPSTPEIHISDEEDSLMYDAFAGAIANPAAYPSGGPIVLELAAGPNGGFLPLILRHNPEAHVLLNDILYPLLEEWQAVLRAAGAGRNVGFVAADARQLPVRSGSIDVISGAIPFTEILAPGRAIAECYRVLRPGGLLLEHEGVLASEDMGRLSPGLRTQVEENMPAWPTGAGPLLRSAGFVDIRETAGSTVRLVPEEGFIPGLAAKEGVDLHMQWRFVSARKP